jgi:hypothetical protein
MRLLVLFAFMCLGRAEERLGLSWAVSYFSRSRTLF